MKEIKILCPICGLSVEENEELTACPSCGAVYHADCWEKNGGCVTFACPDQPYIPTARSGYVLCPQCGEEWPEGKKFCAKCGAKLETKVPEVPPVGYVLCPHCGTACPEGKKFCAKCGTKLDVQIPQDDPNVCRHCGAPLKPGKKFCTKCGAAREHE